MKIGLVKANFPGERRVPLLPKDIKDFKNEILVEEGFGKFLGSVAKFSDKSILV